MIKIQHVHEFSREELDRLKAEGNTKDYIDYLERESFLKIGEKIKEYNLYKKEIITTEDRPGIPPGCEQHRITLFIMKLEELRKAIGIIDRLTLSVSRAEAGQLQELKDLLIKE